MTPHEASRVSVAVTLVSMFAAGLAIRTGQAYAWGVVWGCGLVMLYLVVGTWAGWWR